MFHSRSSGAYRKVLLELFQHARLAQQRDDGLRVEHLSQTRPGRPLHLHRATADAAAYPGERCCQGRSIHLALRLLRLQLPAVGMWCQCITTATPALGIMR